jgi:hypothetical protein
MFRRVLTTATSRAILPRAAATRTLVAPMPNVVAAKRGYHEKDMFLHLTWMDGEADGAELLDHYSNPRNVGSMNKGDLDVGTGLVGAPACVSPPCPTLPNPADP